MQKHILTQKHIGNQSAIKKVEKGGKGGAKNFLCTNCNRSYLSNSGLWRHKKKCINIKECSNNNIITENTPPSIAAGCIYFASKWNPLNITRKQISTVCKISEVTINKCSKKIEGERNLFCDDGLDGKENTSDQDWF